MLARYSENSQRMLVPPIIIDLGSVSRNTRFYNIVPPQERLLILQPN